MSRLEKSGAVEISLTAGKEISTRPWGRRYVEDYATAVQLSFGLLCGLAMLINNFIRLYADEPAKVKTEEFPHETDANERQSLSLSQKRERLSLSDPDRKDALKRLREHLKAVAFYHPNRWFKADLVRGGVTIRLF